MKTLSRLFTLCLLLLKFYGFSQNFSSRNFTTMDGLPDQYVYASFQDNKGFLWLATTQGLVCFDGQEFENRSPKLQEGDFIYSITADKQHTLWFGSFMGKVFSCAANSKQLVRFKDSISGSVDRIIPSANNKQMFIVSKGSGIYVLGENKLTQLPFSQIYQFNQAIEAQPGILLLARPDGLFKANIAERSVTKVRGADADVAQMQLMAGGKRLLLGINGGGLAEGILNAGLDSIVIKTYPDPWGISRAGISAFHYDAQSELIYLITRDEVFHVFDPLALTLTDLPQNQYQATANSMLIDRDRNIWVSTAGKGVYRLYREEFGFLGINSPVFAMCRLGSKLIFGTDNGLLVADSTGAISRYNKPEGRAQAGKVTALYNDGVYVWVGFEQNGLYVFEAATGKQLKVEFETQSNIGVNAITGNPSGNEVYVCTNLDGAFIYRNGKLVNHFSVQNSLLHNNVYYAAATPDGAIYYATHNTAINFSKGDQVYEINMGNNGLISDFNSFAIAPDGNIAIGTNGDGVYFLKDTTIVPMPLNNKLESKFCNAVVYDNHGNLWIATRYSIYKYYPAQQVLKKMDFGNDNSILFGQNAFYLDKGGEVLFGTNRSAIRFKNSARTLDAPECYIRALKISDSLVAAVSGVEFKNGRYNISFVFSALDLRSSEQVKFSYILEGRDSKWSEPASTRQVDFFSLTEGDYEFKVRAYNSEGFTGDTYASFKFRIAAPVWKKVWFWLLVFLLLATLVYGIVRVRTAALVRAKLKLEHIVEEKTHELRLEKEQVEAKNVIIEEQNKDITASITYAKRIQEAILPDKDLNEQLRKNLLIYYKPKDIVSGDFYWIAARQDKYLFAACDCTGHGVPGAFMSMIGITLFNKIVFDNNESDPARIITEMDHEISKSLRQENTGVTDGMEAGLCSIDFNERRVEFCGAKRPLYVFRKTGTGYELEEHKPDKYPIGGIIDLVTKSFTLKRIQAQPGDMIYMFSDGLVDQFGDDGRGRIGSKRVRELLHKTAALPISEQRDVIDAYVMGWKGERHQTDDILLLGIRFE